MLGVWGRRFARYHPSTHCTATGYFVKSNPSADWLVGGLANGVNKNRGYLRELLISGRAWSLSDVQEYYNNGAGLAVPFYSSCGRGSW